MASSRIWITPYNYVQNNPIMTNDPIGALDDGGGNEEQNNGGNSGGDKVVNDSKGQNTLVDKNTQIVNSGKKLIDTNGSEYIDVKGIGWVNKSFLDKIPEITDTQDKAKAQLEMIINEVDKESNYFWEKNFNSNNTVSE